MDMPRSRERSYSHDSFRSSNRGYREPSSYHTRTRKLPACNSGKTSLMLESPGPLESMLKTTTETRNLGEYSIKAEAPSVNCHTPPQNIAKYEDAALLVRTHINEDREPFTHDDRLRLPSCRNVASDIISLYDSETLPSGSTSFNDEKRSYSLATSGSRRVSSYRSNCTLESQPGTIGFQHSRSPFPCPPYPRHRGAQTLSPLSMYSRDTGGRYEETSKVYCSRRSSFDHSS